VPFQETRLFRGAPLNVMFEIETDFVWPKL